MARTKQDLPAPTPGQPPVPANQNDIEISDETVNTKTTEDKPAGGITDTSSEESDEQTINLNPPSLETAEEEKPDKAQEKTDNAILEKILTDLPQDRFNTAMLSGRFETIYMPHQKFLLENYFGRDGVKYTEGMARIFSKYGNSETGYQALQEVYDKYNK